MKIMLAGLLSLTFCLQSFAMEGRKAVEQLNDFLTTIEFRKEEIDENRQMSAQNLSKADSEYKAEEEKYSLARAQGEQALKDEQSAQEERRRAKSLFRSSNIKLREIAEAIAKLNDEINLRKKSREEKASAYNEARNKADEINEKWEALAEQQKLAISLQDDIVKKLRSYDEAKGTLAEQKKFADVVDRIDATLEGIVKGFAELGKDLNNVAVPAYIMEFFQTYRGSAEYLKTDVEGKEECLRETCRELTEQIARAKALCTDPVDTQCPTVVAAEARPEGTSTMSLLTCACLVGAAGAIYYLLPSSGK